MGDYTLLTVKCKLHKKFIAPISDLVENNLDWSDIIEKYNLNFLRIFASVPRSGLIPNSGYLSEREIRKVWGKGIWEFECELKDYENTIEEFFKVLPYMIDKLYQCETHYDCDYHPKIFKLSKKSLKIVFVSQLREPGDSEVI